MACLRPTQPPAIPVRISSEDGSPQLRVTDAETGRELPYRRMTIHVSPDDVVRAEIEVSPERVQTTATAELTCEVAGKRYRLVPADACPNCDGRGDVEVPSRDGVWREHAACPRCTSVTPPPMPANTIVRPTTFRDVITDLWNAATAILPRRRDAR